MRHPRRKGDREQGQIIVLFALVLVVILAFGAIVVDLGFLRNNRQILVNTLDAAALAAGTKLPIDGSSTALPTGQLAAATSLIDATIKANYPALPTGAYTVEYRCLVGVDPNTNKAWISRDVPAACNPGPSLGWTGSTGLATKEAAFTNVLSSAGPTRNSACDPSAGDKCNVVRITGSSNTQFSLGPVVGVNSGSTGGVVSVACNGPCGASPVVPVDLVIILDRTLSMAGSSGGVSKITALQEAAKAILSVYDPAKQRVALALTGPSWVDASGSPITKACGSGSAYGVGNNDNWTPLAKLSASVTNSATSIKVTASTGLPFPTSGTYTITVDSEQMTVTGGQGTLTWTVTRGVNGTTKASHSSGASVYGADGWTAGPTTVGMWVPVGLSGTDTNPVRALPNPNGTAGTYSVGGTPSTNSYIVPAINCISAFSDGTDLATPIAMAQWYLDHYGRQGVTQGIILETDGKPQYGFDSTLRQPGTNVKYTCQAAADAAAAAKADTTNTSSNPDIKQGIQIFTVGYGVDSSVRCPIYTTSLTADNGTYNRYESTTGGPAGSGWSGVQTTTLLRTMATDSSNYYENATTATLKAIFGEIATKLARGGAHLIQLCPAPIVNSVVGPTPWLPVTLPAVNTVTISGQYFTGATSVLFGGAPATSFTVAGDTLITAKTPLGASGILITTPCGTN